MATHRSIALVLALLMALLALVPASFAETQEDTVIAVFENGREILQSDADEVVTQINNYYSQYGYDMTSEDLLPIVRQMAMETLLQEYFYADTAAELGLDQFTEEEQADLDALVLSTYEGLISQVYSIFGIEPAEDATPEEQANARETAVAYLDSIGYTYSYVTTTETQNTIYDRVTEALTAHLTVPEDQVMEAFNSHVAEANSSFICPTRYSEPVLVR